MRCTEALPPSLLLLVLLVRLINNDVIRASTDVCSGCIVQAALVGELCHNSMLIQEQKCWRWMCAVLCLLFSSVVTTA
jgi:hypothetical protein